MTQDRSFRPRLGPKDRPRTRPVDPAERIEDEADARVDEQLDKGLKETFPASDPMSINPGAD
jgi:hypothetical protein